MSFIVSKITSGLGNQMFQYALGRRLALERKAILCLDLQWFSNREPGYTPRDFGIGAFHLKARILPFHASVSLVPRIMTTIKEEKHHVIQMLPSKGSLRLEGYWQREEYFAQISDTLRSDFQLQTPLTAARQKIAAQLDDSSVSVHVRRGDYAASEQYSAYFGTCSAEWYAKAFALIRSKIANPRFFIFSDDPAWARANLQLDGIVQYIDPLPDKRDFEDMHLMSRCAHHIIANSSFSWWAAWLNPSPKKIIVAPAQWYRGAPQIPSHVPESWIQI